jgi:hypothetical protein
VTSGALLNHDSMKCSDKWCIAQPRFNEMQ